MKKIVSLFVVASALYSCSQSSEGFKLNGNVEGLEGKVYLTLYEGKQSVRVDSVESVAGVFAFDGNMAEVKLASIESASDGMVTTLFLGNSDVAITGRMDNPKEIVAVGSPWQDEYKGYRAEIASDLDKTLEYIKSSPSSPVAAYVLFREVSYQLPYQEVEQMMNAFAPEVAGSVYLRILGERIEAKKRADVGQPFIEIALPDTAGNVVALSSLIEAGNYVLVDFWASWCPPCRKENPNVVAAFKKYGHKGFTVYSVSLDKEKDAWKKGIEDDGLTWTHVSDLKFWECAPAKEYGVASIPSSFLISPEGTIIDINLREEALHQKLEEIFGAKKSAPEAVEAAL